MAFTVAQKKGTPTNEGFRDYARLLHQRGVDLGKMPRTPDPGPEQRWLHIWGSRPDAQDFAKELRKRTGDKSWAVVEVTAPPTVGPWGPIVIQVSRLADDLVFGLDNLSSITIRSAFPDVKETVYSISLGFKTPHEYAKPSSLESLARKVVPLLTGLTLQQLESLGYSLTDNFTSRTLLAVPPADLVKQQAA